MTNPIDNNGQPLPVTPSSGTNYPKATFNTDGSINFLGMNFKKEDWDGMMKAMLFQMCTWVNKTYQKSRAAQKEAWQKSMDDS